MIFETFTANTYKKLSEHIGIFYNSTNIGVLNTKDSIYLIDTGTCAEDAKNLLESLTEIFPNKKVKAIFNTHSHSDHCGGNAYVVEKTNCKVGTPYLESLIMKFPYLTGALYWGGMPFESLEGQGFVNQVANKVDFILTSDDDTGGFVNKTGGLGKKATVVAEKAAVPEEELQVASKEVAVVEKELAVSEEKATVVPEEPTFSQEKPQFFAKEAQNPLEKVKLIKGKIELDELFIEIISLPGHFFDQVGFLVTDKSENKKVFFLGDGFFGIPLLNRFWIPFIYEPEDFRKSIEKIEEIYADFYIPGHGDVCTNENLEAVAEFNIIVTLEFEKLIKKLLLEKPQNQEELLKSVADYAGLELKESNYILIGTTLRSYLSSMNRRGILEHKIVENRLIWSVI